MLLWEAIFEIAKKVRNWVRIYNEESSRNFLDGKPLECLGKPFECKLKHSWSRSKHLPFIWIAKKIISISLRNTDRKPLEAIWLKTKDTSKTSQNIDIQLDILPGTMGSHFSARGKPFDCILKILLKQEKTIWMLFSPFEMFRQKATQMLRESIQLQTTTLRKPVIT